MMYISLQVVQIRICHFITHFHYLRRKEICICIHCPRGLFFFISQSFIESNHFIFIRIIFSILSRHCQPFQVLQPNIVNRNLLHTFYSVGINTDTNFILYLLQTVSLCTYRLSFFVHRTPCILPAVCTLQ